MPCSVHTEPCSPGICGQQERLFPITGKCNSHAPIIGQRQRGTRPCLTRLVPLCPQNLSAAFHRQYSERSKYRFLLQVTPILPLKVRAIFANGYWPPASTVAG